MIIFGTGDSSQLAEFYLGNDKGYETCFCVDGEYLEESKLNGRPVIATEEIVKHYPPGHNIMFVPLYDNKLREKKAKQVEEMGYSLYSYVSSKATCWSKVGKNCFIMEGNVMQPFVKMGDNVILWSGNHIGHHSVIKNNNFFSSHVVLSGHCTVHEYCWFGVNSTIRDHVEVAEGTTVGMGSVITRNTEPYKKYKGVPAKEYNDDM